MLNAVGVFELRHRGDVTAVVRRPVGRSTDRSSLIRPAYHHRLYTSLMRPTRHREVSCCRISLHSPFLQRVRIARNAERCTARGILSVRPSVCLSVYPSVTFRYCVHTNEDTIVRFSASGEIILLVSGEVKFIRISPPAGALK